MKRHRLKLVGAVVALGLSLALSAAAAVKACGMRLSLWTANSPETFDKCVKQGAYNVTTKWIPPKLANTPAPESP